jgi:NTE family protein
MSRSAWNAHAMTNALVLAGGGVAGIAWELGVLRGIADADPQLAARILAADTVVGTSAGSAVAAQITSGVPLADLYDAQLRAETSEIEVELHLEELQARFLAATAGVTTRTEALQRIGALALATETIEPAARLVAVDARLPVKDWPERDIRLPAIDAVTGETVVFTRESGVALVDAVAASCAVPGVWPPVAIAGRRYVDGGVRSSTNADFAAGAERVLVVQPVLADAPTFWGGLADEIEALKPGEAWVISADQDSVAAFGTNPLSPTTRAASARAGRAIGRAQAAGLSAFWS